MTTVWIALLLETVLALALGAALAVWAHRRLRPSVDREFDRMIAREFGPGHSPEPGTELSRD
ncbi:hypothetical protein Acsp03_04800 [Actinomadura sp. NBRC 104412]|uniref:hypothetical protein n=1 Tax=Actinomadura sp. NBRC 104412 TaxID=3032203 RepID=UPI0024A42D8D|nr:hypothetical protein [Actinomadura sp. NBRC 104412]GLZ03013.1 hypothetical protein Acsp03_04800 [Actinomadura sp. NBRC 104412]